MKELSVQEKAKAYDKAVESLRAAFYDDNNRMCEEYRDACKKIIEPIFPELAESEDERIRKELIRETKGSEIKLFEAVTNEEFVAWLEKLGEQDNDEDSNILQRFSFYSYKDEPNILYLSGLYVNEEYRNKGIGTKILEVAEEVAKSLNRHAIRLKTKKDSNAERLYRTHGYSSLTTEDSDEIWLEKQYEQKPADKVSLNFKKGDILYEQKTMSILLVYERNGSWLMTFCDYWMLKEKLHVEFPYEKYGFVQEMSLVPATKEQSDLLFSKMKEAGYEWDVEKKELKKIEQKIAEWSEEDERMYQSIMDDAIQENQLNGEQTNWLRDIKYRHFSQPQSRWRPSGEQMEFLWKYAEQNNYDGRILTSLFNDLKKLKGM